MHHIRNPNKKKNKDERYGLSPKMKKEKENKIMEKMKFDEFKTAVVGKIREYLPETFGEDSEVKLRMITKNNDIQLTGLVIKAKNSNIAPTIYLEQFFDDYEKGEPINEILQEIADLRVSHDFQDKFDTDEITDFNRCKGNIIPRLIGKKWNKELLSDRPHTDVADLAVIYCISVGERNDMSMSVPITNDLFESWNISLDELHNISISNMERLTPPAFSSIGSVLSNSILEDDMTEEEKEEALAQISAADDSLFVLTNQQKLYGAAQVLNKRTMERINDKVGKNFYVLPSSIHEILILPATPELRVSDLKSMVREVNETEVSPQERLSDNVYVYRPGIGLVSAD